MKRVLCVVASLNTGGAETFLMKVMRNIDKTEYMLDFIVSAPGVYDNEVRALGGRIYTIPLRTEHPFKAFYSIYRIVKNNQYKYFLKLCDTPIGVFDLIAARLGNAKRISVRSCNASSNTNKQKELLYSVIRPLFNTLCNCRIAPSELAAKYTFGEKMLNKGKTSILKNGINLKEYCYDEQKRIDIRNEFHVKDNEVLVGHIGRFTQQKNHEFLIDIFNEYYKLNRDSKLILVGTGELMDTIRNKTERLNIKNVVIFTGVRKDIPNILSAIDVLLLPSFYEGMPNTVIEAQATGLRCFVSDRVTREANITGNVEFIPIDQGTKSWVHSLSFQKSGNRFNNQMKMKECGYDISDVIETFVLDIFGNNTSES